MRNTSVAWFLVAILVGVYVQPLHRLGLMKDKPVAEVPPACQCGKLCQCGPNCRCDQHPQTAAFPEQNALYRVKNRGLITTPGCPIYGKTCDCGCTRDGNCDCIGEEPSL
jgi:hypothetical protein